MSIKNKVVIGSRESRLAVLQSEIVRDYIADNNPELDAELLTMKTTGDIILDRTLDKVGGKGLFVKELDKALAEGRSDLSVHSLKDVPMEIPEELPLIAFSKREDPRDVLVFPAGKDYIAEGLPIGCSGPRRLIQLKELFPEHEFKSIRGNVITRLKKLDDGEYGALVLAAAGLKRLGLEHRISRYFEPEEIIPAAGQGILAVQGKSGRDYSYLEGFEDRDSAFSAIAERAFVHTLNGGCSSPVAAHAVIDGDKMTLMGLYYDEKTEAAVKDSISGPAADGERLGRELALKLKGQFSTASQGKVWLVGAGPGDLGLFTLKGMEVLQKADVVVYDSLVGAGVLSCIPEHAETINVGKRAANHTMPQEEINRVLVKQAQMGKKVVRLKGGDPFMFGRGGEELEMLCEAGIPYEVVPGVTAAVSVPAYNGIPVTHRDYCSSVHIITGHKRAGKDYDMDFEALVRTGGTLVFLMGVAALPVICKGLISGGMDRDTPAAILQQGTTAGQKKIVATVSTLEDEVRRQGIETPAIIVVGKVCSLAEEFEWYEKLPLFATRILVTRPKNRISVMAHKLRSQGAEVIEIPSVKTVPKQDQSELAIAVSEIEKYRWLVFTSPYGVKVFFDEMLKSRIDVRRLQNVRLAAIGPSTASEIEKHGLLTDIIPEKYYGNLLGKAVYEACEEGDNVLIARAELGGAELMEELQNGDKKIGVTDIAIYDTVYDRQEAVDIKKMIDEDLLNCVTFTSASTVKGFAEAADGADLTRIKAACIGTQTEKCARELGMKTWVADEATMDSLTELIIGMKERREI